MAAPVGPEPSAPCGRRSEAERRELQGVPHAARLCRFPGPMKAAGKRPGVQATGAKAG